MATVTYFPAASGGGGLPGGTGVVKVTSGTGGLASATADYQLPVQWTTFTQSGNTSDVTFASGLAGDTDGDYEFEGDLLLATGSAMNLTFQPNGLATNQASSLFLVGTGTSSPSNLAIANPSSTADTVRIRGTISSKTASGSRLITCVATSWAAGVLDKMFFLEGQWTDTSTAITTLGVHTSVASGLLTNSIVRWRKKARSA
jgi:hypothetical protein